MLTKQQKEEIKYIWILKRRFENSIDGQRDYIFNFEINHGNSYLSKQLINHYSSLLIALESTKRAYYEFCKENELKSIR